jgi:hypothetical protein
MYQDPTAVDQSNDRLKTVASQQSSEIAGYSGVEGHKGPGLPNTEENPEFAKWWKRWVSRAQRISVRRNPWARRKKLEPPAAHPQAAPAGSADREFKRYS